MTHIPWSMYNINSIAKRRQNNEYRAMQKNLARNRRAPPKYTEPKANSGALSMGHLLTDVGRKELEEIRREEVESMAARGGNSTRNPTHEQYTAPPDRPEPGLLQMGHASRDDAQEVFQHMKRKMEARNAARSDHALQNRIHEQNTPPPKQPGPHKVKMGHALTDRGQMELAEIRRKQGEGSAGTSQFSGPRTDPHHAASSHKLFVCESCQAEMRNRDSSVQNPRPKSAVRDNMTSLMGRLSL